MGPQASRALSLRELRVLLAAERERLDATRASAAEIVAIVAGARERAQQTRARSQALRKRVVRTQHLRPAGLGER
jgi:hypothetical protein